MVTCNNISCTIWFLGHQIHILHSLRHVPLYNSSMQFICLISKRANGTVSGAMATWIYTQHPCFHAAAIHALHCFTQSLSIFQLPFRIFSGTMLPVIIFSQSLPSICSSHPLPIGLSTEEFRCFHVATYRYTRSDIHQP